MKSKNNKGFTLVELIVVLVILAILIALIVPALTGYIENAKGKSQLVVAKQVYVATNSAIAEWYGDGKPGNSDNAYKQNLEKATAEFLKADIGEMKSQNLNQTTYENVVQVALSLPSYYSQGWQGFIANCKKYHYKNYTLIYIGKGANSQLGHYADAVYYVSPDGKYAARIVKKEGTKLGSVDQPTGIHWERIEE